MDDSSGKHFPETSGFMIPQLSQDTRDARLDNLWHPWWKAVSQWFLLPIEAWIVNPPKSKKWKHHTLTVLFYKLHQDHDPSVRVLLGRSYLQKAPSSCGSMGQEIPRLPRKRRWPNTSQDAVWPRTPGPFESQSTKENPWRVCSQSCWSCWCCWYYFCLVVYLFIHMYDVWRGCWLQTNSL